MHLEKKKQFELIISEWFFQEPVETRPKKIYNHRSLREIARGIMREIIKN